MSNARAIPALILIVVGLGSLTGCATYYEKSASFQRAFVSGDFAAANAALSSGKVANNVRLLYLLQKGVVLHMLGDSDESNVFFEQAYQYAEDLRTNYAAEAVALLTNPQTVAYGGEDFEVVAINYYKAINYLEQGDLESALVECRRMNVTLNRINDRYANNKNRYRVDAAALLVMGLVYEASGEYNDAFIAYRNAFQAYQDVYAKHFGVQVPSQLKQDLLRMAYVNGFDDELAFYERLFGTEYVHRQGTGGDLIVLWHTGLGPVKDEWSINFVVVPGENNTVWFVNDTLGLAFPFAMGSSSGGIGDLKFIRVAFPRYRERKPYFHRARIETPSGIEQPLEMIQNVNAIAFATLHDRMVRELSKALLRLALKQASEQAARQVNANLGALLSITNAVTERSDTRNWQTLPYAIHYARIALPEGRQFVELHRISRTAGFTDSRMWNVDINGGQTVFRIEHAIESYPLAN